MKTFERMIEGIFEIRGKSPMKVWIPVSVLIPHVKERKIALIEEFAAKLSIYQIDRRKSLEAESETDCLRKPIDSSKDMDIILDLLEHADEGRAVELDAHEWAFYAFGTELRY